MNKKVVTKFQKGFTLVELLVVIGILGILAAALIATIDPIEQLNRANDTNKKNTAVELKQATERYFAIKSAFPWAAGTLPAAEPTCTWAGGAVAANALGAANFYTPCLGSTTVANSLIGVGELKANFNTATSILSAITVSNTGTSFTACFPPQSKAVLRDASTIYNNTGGPSAPANNCGTATAVINQCFWCAK